MLKILKGINRSCYTLTGATIHFRNANWKWPLNPKNEEEKYEFEYAANNKLNVYLFLSITMESEVINFIPITVGNHMRGVMEKWG